MDTPSTAPPQAPSTQPPSAPPTPVSAPPPSTPAPSPVSPQLPTGSATAPPTPQSVRDALSQYGFDAKSYTDDHQALQHLVSLARQASQSRPLIEAGQTYLQHAKEFEAWRQQQQAPKQAESWWTAPQYDPRWEQMIVRDPVTGELRPAPGAPPDVVQKLTNWREHQRSFFDKFSADPISAIRPGIEQVIQEVAGTMVQRYMAEHQEKTAASNFLQSNSDWIYERSADGSPLSDAQGGKLYTPAGQRFAQHVNTAASLGLYTTQQQLHYAMNMLQRDYLAATRQAPPQPSPAPNPSQDQKEAFLARHQPVPAPSGNANATAKQPNGVSQRGLQEALMDAFKSAGFQPGTNL